MARPPDTVPWSRKAAGELLDRVCRVIASFLPIWLLAAVGYLAGRTRILGDQGELVLGRFVPAVLGDDEVHREGAGERGRRDQPGRRESFTVDRPPDGPDDGAPDGRRDKNPGKIFRANR